MSFYVDKILAQQIVDTVKDICGYHINFIDATGTILASTNENRIGTFHEIGKKAISTGTMIEVNATDCFAGAQEGVNLPVCHKNRMVCVIGISGPPQEIKKYAYLAEKITRILLQERELGQFSRSQAEKKHFMILALISRETANYDYVCELMNLFKINPATSKRMLIFRIAQTEGTISSITEQHIQAFFEAAGIHLFTHMYPDSFLAITDDEVFADHAYRFKNFASAHEEELKIAVGKSCPVFQLADSYDSCLTVMKSMDDKTCAFRMFDELALEIIFSCVNQKHRQEYVNKIFSRLSEDDLRVLAAYFEHDLSLAETSQELFIHKNTLQNKLIKIQHLSGYDPRKFREAVMLYLALKLH